MEVVQAEPRAQGPAPLVECVGLSRLSPHPSEGEPVPGQADRWRLGIWLPCAQGSHLPLERMDGYVVDSDFGGF